MSAEIRLYRGTCGYRCGNAGDEFSAPLISHLTGAHVLVMAEPEAAELAAAGSIYQLLGEKPIAVWGAGVIRDEDVFWRPDDRVLALRGPLTARRIGHAGDVPFGDPGLLVPQRWPPAAEKRWDVGIVPHYVDAQNQLVTAFARRNQDRVTVIDICSNVADVLRSISECRVVLSSSLHGLVFADAYEVPNAWLRLGTEVVGGSFKFRDYYGGTRGPTDVLPLVFTGNETVDEVISRVHSWHQPFDPEPIASELEDALLAWMEART